jgi:mRNA interferase HicA
MKRRGIERKLRSLRWFLTRHGGRHDVWSNGERDLVVPRHNEINEYTAKAILKEARGGRS